MVPWSEPIIPFTRPLLIGQSFDPSTASPHQLRRNGGVTSGDFTPYPRCILPTIWDSDVLEAETHWIVRSQQLLQSGHKPNVSETNSPYSMDGEQLSWNFICVFRDLKERRSSAGRRKTVTGAQVLYL